MMINGTLRCHDAPHISSFLGSIAQVGTLVCVDSTYLSQISGYILSDSTSIPSSLSFRQGYMTGRGDMTLTLTDWTWCGGTWDSTTYVDGTLRTRWFDPIWINYSLWYVQDSSNPSLIGYRYNEPISDDVGRYYVPMTIPQTTGRYETRWRYQKDSSSYAREIRQPILCTSGGISADKT